MEVVGMYLGLSQDKALFDYFRRNFSLFFPVVADFDRMTFVRQATNLWAVKDRLWCLIRNCLLPYDPSIAIMCSFPLAVCQFARDYRCSRFRGETHTGCDHTIHQTFYGFRLHVRLAWPGVITQIYLAPGNVLEWEVVPDLTEGSSGVLLGDRNYWLPKLKEALQRLGIVLVTPFRSPKHAPLDSWSLVLSRVGYRIDTVFGQMVDRCQAKRVCTCDLWHLRNRLLRMFLMHPLTVLFHIQTKTPPRQLARLVAECEKLYIRLVTIRRYSYISIEHPARKKGGDCRGVDHT